MHINDLIIEVTRRCNMACDHCLRGDEQSIDISPESMESLISQVDYIDTVTFSGGEPSLNSSAISQFIELCMRSNVGVGSFYIATNGLSIDVDFIINCLKLYSYCDDKELCSVEVSNDYFHACEDSYDTELLEGLSFFSRKFTKENYNYRNNDGLLIQGRAFFGGREMPQDNEIQTQEDFNENQIYLNCEGDIIQGCDWSYDNQAEHKLCSVEDIEEYYNNLEE